VDATASNDPYNLQRFADADDREFRSSLTLFASVPADKRILQMEEYRNCAQSSLAAIQDRVSFVPKDELVFLAATPLSGGAFTGCDLAIGSVCGLSRTNFGDKAPPAGQVRPVSLRPAAHRLRHRGSRLAWLTSLVTPHENSFGKDVAL